MIDEILQQRGQRYGEFRDNAAISQALKEILRSAEYWELKDPIVREALDNIMHKVARVISGDERYPDNFVDIIGYAQLVLDEIAPEIET